MLTINQNLFYAIFKLARHNQFVDQLMIFFSQDTLWLYVGLYLVLWIALRRQKYVRQIVSESYLIGAFAILLCVVIGHFCYHPRPFVEIPNLVPLIHHRNDSSFPSKHAAVSFAIAFGNYRNRPRFAYLFFGLAIVISFSRIYVGVHWPLDIIGAIAVGFFAYLIMERCFVYLRQK